MAGYRYSKEYKVCAVVPRSPCGGISHPPRTPQGIPRLMRPFGGRSPRDWSAGRWTLTGIEPVPAEATTIAVASRPGRLRLSLDPSSRGQIAPPCDPRPGLSRPGPRPAFRRRLRPGGRCRLSLRTPIDQEGRQPPWTPGGAGVTARNKRGEGWTAVTS